MCSLQLYPYKKTENGTQIEFHCSIFNTFTKTIQLNSPYELSIVDKLAAEGWLLCAIVPYNDVFVYWFQSKKKIYVNSKAHLHEIS